MQNGFYPQRCACALLAGHVGLPLVSCFILPIMPSRDDHTILDPHSPKHAPGTSINPSMLLNNAHFDIFFKASALVTPQLLNLPL
jgi:hypothetical protein